MLMLSYLKRLAAVGAIAMVLFATARINAQNLTLEGQTGGFITPTAYVVLSKDHVFSYPAIGYHFVNASSVIGNVYTFSIEEGIANRAEFGYTRSVHTEGNSPAFSSLWDYSGMNVFNGKVVAVKDGQFGAVDAGHRRGIRGAYGRQVCERRTERGTLRNSEVLYQRRCVRGSNEDVVEAAGAVSAELRLQDDERVDLWAGRTVYAVYGTALWGPRDSDSAGA